MNAARWHDGTSEINLRAIGCFRHASLEGDRPEQYTWDKNESDEENYELMSAWERPYADAICLQRECPWFYRYIPSHSPTQHLELMDRDHDRHAQMRGHIISGLIAGFFAIVAVAITLALTPNP